MLDGDKIVGTSSYCCSRFLDMKDYGEIISIYLLPEYTKKGYGKLLLQKAIDGIKGLGFSNVFLWVLEENTNARNFYEKFGFLPQDKYLKDNIGGKELKEMLYTILYQDK